MGGKRAVVRKTAIVPADLAAALDRYVPDLENWPKSWSYEPADVRVGARIAESFKPFLLDLLQKDLAPKTLRRHRDNLWMLGGEIIRRRHLDSELAAMTNENALLELIDDLGGPILSGGASESEQDSFDATCRKLYSFINPRKKP